jgi:muramoyltetrapeptide carboxypeptidase LdcA involved in peptidoglycan recycling
LIVQSSTGKYLPKDEDIDDTILVLETAEDIPEHWIIEYLLTGFGERGWFDKFQAVLVGRPKAWEFNKQNDTETKAAYRQKQRETVVKTIREYNTAIPIVQNVDFGHTDPQIVLPFGRKAVVSPANNTIKLNYS